MLQTFYAESKKGFFAIFQAFFDYISFEKISPSTTLKPKHIKIMYITRESKLCLILKPWWHWQWCEENERKSLSFLLSKIFQYFHQSFSFFFPYFSNAQKTNFHKNPLKTPQQNVFHFLIQRDIKKNFFHGGRYGEGDDFYSLSYFKVWGLNPFLMGIFCGHYMLTRYWKFIFNLIIIF